MRARLITSVRSRFTSGAIGERVWSNSATATVSTTSVKLVPNRLIAVKTLRRCRTFQASFR